MSATAVLVGAALGLIVGAVHLLDRHLGEGAGKHQRVQGARWASRRDLRQLHVDGPKPGRLILGRHGKHLIAAQERASVLIVGPSTTSLKTSGFAIPSLLEWRGPALVTSVKSDLLLATIARRRKLGKAMVFDPGGVTGEKSKTTATPLSACGSWRGAMRMAHWLSQAARASSSGGLQDAAFWHTAAEKLLAPLLYAAASSGGTMEDVIEWLNGGGEADSEVRKRLGRTEASDQALSAWKANHNREERQRSSIYTTAETILSAFSDPCVLAASKGAEYTPAALLDGEPNTLYLCAPAHEQERLRTLFAAMTAELVAEVYESSAKTGKPLDPPLLIVLDEAANIAPLPDLDVLASSGAGQGIQLVTVFQDLAQVQARYGRRAQTIVNNHRAKVFASGVGDPDTLRYISQVIGAGAFRQRSETAAEQGRSSATEGTTYRDLAPPNVIRGAKPGSALLVYGHLAPGRIELRPWFKDAALSELVEGRGGDES
ncbi:MAG: type IV secretory system conjugative DNA transfer family protein [Solirubrobacterales bacterium]